MPPGVRSPDGIMSAVSRRARRGRYCTAPNRTLVKAEMGAASRASSTASRACESRRLASTYSSGSLISRAIVPSPGDERTGQ